MLLQQGLTRSFDFRFQLMRSILLSTSLRAIGLNGAGIMEVANLGAQVDEGVDASLREGTMYERSGLVEPELLLCLSDKGRRNATS